MVELFLNSKTGSSFNLPAVETCPEATNACKAVCYAGRGQMHPEMRGGQAAKRRFEELKENLSEGSGIHFNIPKTHNAIRLMGSGDIFSKEFCIRLFNMCKVNSDKIFWMYTRSIKILRDVIKKEEIPQNLTIFISVDSENRKTHKRFAEKNGLSIAYMGEVKGSENSFICPAIHNPDRFPLSKKFKEAPCQKCKYCFSPKVKKHRLKVGIKFPIH